MSFVVGPSQLCGAVPVGSRSCPNRQLLVPVSPCCKLVFLECHLGAAGLHVSSPRAMSLLLIIMKRGGVD